MRVALISIAGQPCEAGRDMPFTVAGKTIAQRQLDFALAAGAEHVIAIGDGASAEAVALRHVAEAAGVRFEVVHESHGLLGVARAADELLVLAPKVLPDAPAALELLSKGNKVVVVPANSGIPAGFERIDLERAWAGAMLISGSLVERLAELPADSEPTSALLRVALQARVREVRLADELLNDGSWARVGDSEVPGSRDAEWLKRNVSPAPAPAASGWLARTALRQLAIPLLSTQRAVTSLVAALAVLLAGAVAASAFGLPPMGFVLFALASLSSELLAGLLRLRDAPFAKQPRRSIALVSALVDLALAVCAALAIEGDALHRLFAPLVLLGALHLGRFSERADWTALLGDRALLAVVLAIAAGFGFIEPALMLAGLVALALNLAKSRAQRG